MMQQTPPASNGAAAGSGQNPSDQQAYHHHQQQQQQSWMMQQHHQGQPPAGWNPQSAPSPGQPQQQQYGGGGSQNPGSAGEIRSLWIGDLQPWMDENYLMTVFNVTGEAQSAKVIRNKQNGYSEGYGFIEFASHATAERVLQTYNGAPMPNCEQQTFRLNWAQLGAGERRQAEGPEHTVFVGDLAPDVTDLMLTETFKAVYSSVKGAKVVTDRTTGRSKGYGFVRFGDESEQIRAMTEMNGQYCSSRPMRTGPAANKKPLTMQPGSYQNNQGNPGESDPTNTTIFVGALDQSVTEDLLKSVFGQFGELVHVKIPAGKRCGFVQFANRACAEQALSMLNGTQLGGQSVRLSWGHSPSNKQTQTDQGQYGGGGGGYYGYPPQGYEAYGYAPPPQDPNAYYGGYAGGGYGNYQQPGGYQQQQQ
ncbi:PREDICTED: polyadenylate-binding protein RBP45C [Camelina sativa]|uniref:Polyadenylate-binding protein RBP45C n=1 Tax=Camelina sativa TaxID=90675 RepID=A0ABM0TYW9_CAMSA|nr:PREDICTED: polyadenylate-binding protein RBP45C [Camelina sativa]